MKKGDMMNRETARAVRDRRGRELADAQADEKALEIRKSDLKRELREAAVEGRSSETHQIDTAIGVAEAQLEDLRGNRIPKLTADYESAVAAAEEESAAEARRNAQERVDQVFGPRGQSRDRRIHALAAELKQLRSEHRGDLAEMLDLRRLHGVSLPASEGPLDSHALAINAVREALK